MIRVCIILRPREYLEHLNSIPNLDPGKFNEQLLSTQTFHLGQRLYQNICFLLIYGDILENYFSLLDFNMESIMLDLNVL
jgi:hypothetical protein